MRTINRNKVGGGVTLLLLLLLFLTASVTGVIPGTTPPAAAETLAGNDGNDNPVLGEVQSWTDLKKAVEGKEDWYKKCLQGRNGITWAQVNQYSALENKGNDLRVVLVSNADVSDASARQMLKDKGTKDVNDLPVIRVSGFTNTFGLPSDKCKASSDDRSQVRLALGVPNDVTNLGKGFRKDKGVLAMCGNPWDVPPGGHKPPGSTPTPTPTPTPTTTPTPTPTPCESQTATPCPKGTNIPGPPSPPASVSPTPIGTAAPPTRPASPDPSPSNGFPVDDVNPPANPEVPDSGSGAGNATASPPAAPSSPAPGPTPTSTGIVDSD